MKHLAYLNKFFWQYRGHLFLGILFVALSNWARVLQPQMVRHALDLVYENLSLYQLYAGSEELQGDLFRRLSGALLMFGGIVLLLAILMGLFMFLMRQTLVVMSRLIENDLRREIYAHYQHLDLTFYKRNNTGDLMARITEDVNKVRMYLGPALLYALNLITLFLFTVSAMFNVNIKLALYTLIPLPLLSLSIYYVSTLINRRSEAIQKQLSKLNVVAQEVYSGIRVIKSYAQEKAIGKYFEHESDEFKAKSMDLVRVEAFFFPLMTVLIGASTLITIYAGGILVMQGEVSPGNVAEFVIYVNMLTFPFMALGWIASLIQRAAASQKRINEFLKTEPEVKDSGKGGLPIKGDVVFENVTFTYPTTEITALKNISFSIAAGEKVAIIGRTGSGKTSIMDLLLRMYDVSEGRILLDGIDLKEHRLTDLRRQIGYVPQDVFLFSDTVTNNIAFGVAESERHRAPEFARHAAVYDDIAGLQQGFDTVVGERGVMLSGGQKQRISIARALMKEPRLLLLDDCLSAVDTNTERQIVGYLQETLQDKTAIVITHRVYSSLKFDKIIVLADGALVEIGTHDELMANGGYYAEQWELQKVEEVTQA